MSDLVDSRHSLDTDAATALVIDDEPMIRHIIRRMLEPEICRVAEAGSGEEGLRIIQHGIPPIDVVLTDLTMPCLDGCDVVEVLAKYRPDLPVGVVSGCGVVVAARVRELGARLLAKPFSHSELTRLVSSLVADARAVRARAGAHRAQAGRAREADTSVRQQHTNMWARLDLVAAAWNLHCRFRTDNA